MRNLRVAWKLAILSLMLGWASAWAVEMNFSKCQEFYLRASKDFGGIRGIHIGEGKYIAYSRENLSAANPAKADTAIGLYLFNDSPSEFKYTLKPINKKIPAVAISKDSIIKGKIIKKQESISDFAIFTPKNSDQKLGENAIISDICYQAYGISTGTQENIPSNASSENIGNFIDKNYIEKFLSQDSNKQYADIGIEVQDSPKGVMISVINPFFNNTQNLQIGDIIKSINGVEIKSVGDFVDFVASLKVGENLNIVVQRDKETINTTLKAAKRLLPFGTQASFLQYFGIIVDENLIVQNDNLAFEFKKGDKILRLNQIIVRNLGELNNAISSVIEGDSEFLSFLIARYKPANEPTSRRNFEFFITIDLEKFGLKKH